jgi:hypothetical protein
VVVGARVVVVVGAMVVVVAVAVVTATGGRVVTTLGRRVVVVMSTVVLGRASVAGGTSVVVVVASVVKGLGEPPHATNSATKAKQRSSRVRYDSDVLTIPLRRNGHGDTAKSRRRPSRSPGTGSASLLPYRERTAAVLDSDRWR